MRKFLLLTILSVLFITAIVSSASLDKITLPSKPTLEDGKETSYLGDKFKQQGDYVTSSKEVYNPIWYPNGHAKQNIATVQAIYQIENKKKGRFKRVKKNFCF